MKNTIIFMSIFLLTMGLIVSADFTPQGDINLRGVYEIKNGTNITANYYFGDGSTLSNVGGGNASWNETRADSLYIAQSDESNLNVNYSVSSNSTTFWASVSSFISKWFYDVSNVLTFNETKLNESTDDRINYHGLINNGSYLSTYNSTYNSKVTDNESWNETYADGLYAPNTTSGIQSLINSTGVYSTYNLTYDGSVNNNSYLSTYNSTYDAKVTDNESWNETRANLLYSGIEWDYNQTEAVQVNTTQMTYNNGFLNILESWLTTFINNWLSGKSTDDLTEGSSNLYDNQSWTEGVADGKYGLIGSGGNLSFNETYTDGLYSGIEWDYNQTTATYTLYNAVWSSTYNATYAGSINNASYLSTYNATYAGSINNASYLSTYNATYDSWAYNQTTAGDARFVNIDGDNMTGNLNMTSQNITTVDCIKFNSGGQICSGS